MRAVSLQYRSHCSMDTWSPASAMTLSKIFCHCASLKEALSLFCEKSRRRVLVSSAGTLDASPPICRNCSIASASVTAFSRSTCRKPSLSNSSSGATLISSTSRSSSMMDVLSMTKDRTIWLSIGHIGCPPVQVWKYSPYASDSQPSKSCSINSKETVLFFRCDLGGDVAARPRPPSSACGGGAGSTTAVCPCRLPPVFSTFSSSSGSAGAQQAQFSLPIAR
mmetsp:Transcript_46284/g.107665  ORF Transcript_46284/g.107665 Transcript_46284/m.107665 type:complete len:222 (+) Transcript_46284:251-916(+)